MKRLLIFIPVVIVAVIILLLTLQNIEGTVTLSEGFRTWIVSVCGRFGWDTLAGWIDSPVTVRRLGHVIEFFVLGVAAAISVRKKRFALLLCICISVADQVIKIYVPGRHFDRMDFPFDAVGYVSGLSVVWITKQMIFAKRGSADD